MLEFFNFAYSSSISNVSPFEKLLLSLGLMFLSLQSSLIILPILIFIFMGLLIIRVDFPVVSFLRLFLLSSSFIVLGTIPIVFEISSASSVALSNFVWNIDLWGYSLGMSLFSLKEGIHLLSRTLSSLFCLYFLILTTPFTDIVIVLKRFRFPLFLLELFILLHRFFIIMLEVISKTIRSQRSRLGFSGYRASFRSLTLLIVSLFDNLYRSIRQFFNALEARSYGGEFPLFERDYSFSMFRFLSIVCILLFLLFFDIVASHP